MRPRDIQFDYAYCLQMASQWLEGPVRGVELDWKMTQLLRPHLRLESRRGLGAEQPVVRFRDGPHGHELAAGMQCYRLEVDGPPLRLVNIQIPVDAYDTCSVLSDLWAVARSDYCRLYRFLRRSLRHEQTHVAPLMPERDHRRLWDNTVGFLRRDCAVLRRYGVPQKRGLLLLGEPGNGKTMACRWLRSQCRRFGLGWRSVTSEEYEDRRQSAQAHELFHLQRPGVIFFDDVDLALRDRQQFGHTPDHSTFLGALDGLNVQHGVVYVFTSNAGLSEIDPAFRRPGRIDVVLHFHRPDATLRRRLIQQCWHADIVGHLPVDQVVAATEGLSFAELEELKRLLVLRHLETQQWDWGWAWNAYRHSKSQHTGHRRIGFALETANGQPERSM